MQERNMKNHYQTLGLEPNCTNEQIKSAFREYAKHFHPDKQQGNWFFEEKFKEVNEAYNTLIDSEKRRKHDEFHNINTSFSKEQKKYSENSQSTTTHKPKRQEKHFEFGNTGFTLYEVIDSNIKKHCILNSQKKKVTEDYDKITLISVADDEWLNWLVTEKKGKYGFIKVSKDRLICTPCIFDNYKAFSENSLFFAAYYNYIHINKGVDILYKNKHCILSDDGEHITLYQFKRVSLWVLVIIVSVCSPLVLLSGSLARNWDIPFIIYLVIGFVAGVIAYFSTRETRLEQIGKWEQVIYN